jgi:hypothetical protein
LDRSRQKAERLDNWLYTTLVEFGLLQLREGVLREILERNAIGPGVIAQRGGGHVNRDARIASHGRERLELRHCRNVDVKH